MSDIFAELCGSQYYSKFDFCKGYWQVPMSQEDMDLTTFVTHRGLFRFRVMPFGLISEWKVDEVVPHFTALPFHSPCHKGI